MAAAGYVAAGGGAPESRPAPAVAAGDASPEHRPGPAVAAGDASFAGGPVFTGGASPADAPGGPADGPGGHLAGGGPAAAASGDSFHDEVLRTTADLDAMLALAGVTGAAMGAHLEDYELPPVPDTPEGVERETTADEQAR
jgi:hypothetical protein